MLHPHLIEKETEHTRVVQVDQDQTIEAHIKAGGSYTILFVQSGNTTLNTRFILDEGATLKAIWISHHIEEATQNIQVEFKGEGINANLSGIARLTGQQKLTTHTHLIHHQPNTNATQFFKRIIEDQAVSEFQGLVHVKSEAQKTDSNQFNHNLILSDKGRAIARPQLEIFADDVKCSHGATVGQLDEEQRFYLQSRGFSEDQANHILIQGFMDEIFDIIPAQLDPAKYRHLLYA